MIEIQALTKQFGSNGPGLRNLSIAIAQGEFVFLVGPSGSGKTTLFNVLHGHTKPDSGSVYVLDYAIMDLSPHTRPLLRREVSVVFQDYQLLPKRTAYENIAFVLQVLGYRNRDIHPWVDHVLELVGLTHKAHEYPHALSGGEQQRVCIARSIVHRPRILLADEPTGNLDPDTAWDIMQLLTAINNTGTSVVVATHDWRMVNRMQKRVLRLQHGELIRDTMVGAYA